MKTLIFELEEPFTEANEKLLARFGVKKRDALTIEMEVQEGETREQAILALNRLDIHVRNIKHSLN